MYCTKLYVQHASGIEKKKFKKNCVGRSRCVGDRGKSRCRQNKRETTPTARKPPLDVSSPRVHEALVTLRHKTRATASRAEIDFKTDPSPRVRYTQHARGPGDHARHDHTTASSTVSSSDVIRRRRRVTERRKTRFSIPLRNACTAISVRSRTNVSSRAERRIPRLLAGLSERVESRSRSKLGP